MSCLTWVWGKQDPGVTSEATSRDRDVRWPNITCGGSTLSWRWKRCWTAHHGKSRSTIEGGRGCHRFVSVLRVDGTKIAPPGDLFDQPSVEMHSIWGNLANHIGDNVVLSPEEVILLIFPVTESLYPRPPQSLKHSKAWEYSRRDCVHKTVRVRPCADCVATLEKLHAVWAGGLEAPRGKRF